MFKHFCFVIVVLLSSCISQKKLQESQKNISINDIEIIIETENNILIFKIVNKSEKQTITLNQSNLHIERLNDKNWEKIKIINCPCGAPCIQNPEQKDILVGKYYIFKWDKKESWCGKRNKNGIPDTISTICQPGTYRIRITYKISQNNTQVIYKGFKIN